MPGFKALGKPQLPTRIFPYFRVLQALTDALCGVGAGSNVKQTLIGLDKFWRPAQWPTPSLSPYAPRGA
jgi:hypothetical protein